MKRPQEEGFSLLEMIVVLAIMAMATTGGLVFLTNHNSQGSDNVFATQLAQVFADARLSAIKDRRDVVVSFDLEQERRVLVDGRPLLAIDGSVQSISILSGKKGTSPSAKAQFVFLPEGSSTGGRVTFTQAATQHTLAVNWLTGLVAFEGATH